jgi:hypothetical protein
MGEQELKVLENKLLRRISGPKKYGQWNSYKKYKGKKPLLRKRHRLKDAVKIDLREVAHEDINFIKTARMWSSLRL